MANPLRNEDKLYEILKKENVSVHPVVWELINHHIRNDLSLISTGIGLLRLTPDWILKEASDLIVKRYKESNGPGEPPPDLITLADRILERIRLMDVQLKKLRELTLKEELNDDQAYGR